MSKDYPEIIIIPADPSPDIKLNWSVREYFGSSIYRLPKNKATWPKDIHAWTAYLADPANIWTLDLPPPVTGDMILAQGLDSPFVASVKVDETGGMYAETDSLITWLCRSSDQPSDDRNSWVSSGIGNKKGIQKLELYSDADEKHDPKPPKE